MTRRINRQKDFTLTLDINNQEFLGTPRDAQRNWILKRVLKEAADELSFFDSRVSSMVAGEDPGTDFETRREGDPEPEAIMESWQIPVMEKMAEIVTCNGGSILEVGYGRGISASFIQKHKPQRHTIVECNKSICNSCRQWIAEQEGRDILLIEGKWQDVLTDLETYDGILFHTYPMDEQDFLENVGKSSNFVEHFFASADRLLRANGKLSYLTLEPDSLGRDHQRSLFSYFSSITMSKLNQLQIPDDTKDALWIPELVVVDICK